MSPASALEELLHSPRLPEYAEIIQRRLADEQTSRERFYREMTDEFKMEFISGDVVNGKSRPLYIYGERAVEEHQTAGRSA